MLDIEAIETINFEQLVTVTDRLLLRGRATQRRLSTNKLIFRHELAEAASRRSSPALPLHVQQPHSDHTQVVKRPLTTFDATSVLVLGTLLTIALVLATML